MSKILNVPIGCREIRFIIYNVSHPIVVYIISEKDVRIFDFLSRFLDGDEVIPSPAIVLYLCFSSVKFQILPEIYRKPIEKFFDESLY